LKKETHIESRTNFDFVRYSQVWEDADLLIEALDLKAKDVVVSIASAGDNSFALLAKGVKKVYAIDLSFPQIACCELRKAMYRQLSHQEHLVFGGVIKGEMDRLATFNALEMPNDVREFWQNHLEAIKKGFMSQGKLDRYFAIFRTKLVRLVHSQKRLSHLFAPKTEDERTHYYDKTWNNLRFKLVCKFFFSRFILGRLGRDKEFFKYVEGSVADRIHDRMSYAFTTLDPSKNPYLQFMYKGHYTDVFPYALRPENYEKIRTSLDRIEFQQISIEAFIASHSDKIDAFNLSNIFEYMSQEEMDVLYTALANKSKIGTRYAYWNFLAPRSSENLRDKLGIKTSQKKNDLFLLKDKAFFYSKFYLDVLGGNSEVRDD